MADYSFKLTIFDRVLLRKMRRILPKHLHSEFEHDLKQIMHSEAAFLQNRTTAGHIFFAAMVLCLHRFLLRKGLSRLEADARLAHELTQMSKRSMRILMWLGMGLSKDPIERLRRISRHKSAQIYGSSFQIDEGDLDNGFVFEVRTCGYRTFLSRHNALELTKILCAWDRVWIDALPGRIRFSRPTTLATGGASCRFEFRRKDDVH